MIDYKLHGHSEFDKDRNGEIWVKGSGRYFCPTSKDVLLAWDNRSFAAANSYFGVILSLIAAGI